MRVATILYEILCYGGIILLPFSYQMAGWIGLILHTVLVNGSSIVLDFLVSPTASENVRRVSDGYKIHRFAVYALMAIQLVAANVFVVGLLNYFNAIDVQPPSLSSTTAVVHLLGSLALNLIVSEIAFTAGHAWLHSTTVGKRIHRLHHLIKNPSWSTNLLIHPLDLAIEFGLPFLAIALMHVYVVGDPFVFRVAITLIYVWYAADHSENLGLSHTVHHTSMESPILTIYGRYEWFERLMGGRSKSKIS